jgi:hypothetical protein
VVRVWSAREVAPSLRDATVALGMPFVDPAKTLEEAFDVIVLGS